MTQPTEADREVADSIVAGISSAHLSDDAVRRQLSATIADYAARVRVETLAGAAKIAAAVSMDAMDKLGYVAGNLGFENGRAKAAAEISFAIEAAANQPAKEGMKVDVSR